MDVLLTCGRQALHADIQFLAYVASAVEVDLTLANITMHPFIRCIQIHKELFLSA